MPKDEQAFLPGSNHELAFKGRVWDVVRETFDYQGESLVRDFVLHSGAVAVLAVNEHDEVLMIRQYRHPVRKYLWEIPAGMLDVEGEALLEAAKRELLEETSHEAAVWQELQTFHASPGGSSESITIFLATDVREVSSGYIREAEEKDMLVRWVPKHEALASVQASEIQSPAAVIAILSWASRNF